MTRREDAALIAIVAVRLDTALRCRMLLLLEAARALHDDYHFDFVSERSITIERCAAARRRLLAWRAEADEVVALIGHHYLVPHGDVRVPFANIELEIAFLTERCRVLTAHLERPISGDARDHGDP